MLSVEETEQIHGASLAMLEMAGIQLQDETLRDHLARQGCRVEGQRVWLPPSLVEDCLAQVPDQWMLYDRAGNAALTLGTGIRTASNSGVAPRIVDLYSGELRSATLQDVMDTTRLLDALPRFGIIGATLVEPTDVPAEQAALASFAATIYNTNKPIEGPGPTNATEANDIIHIGAQVAGGLDALVERPFFSPWVCPVSPLTYPSGLVGAVQACAQAGLPLGVVTNPIAGLTAPMTLAGALAQMHAEILGTLVLAYQVHPGLPILYRGSFSCADMRTTGVLGGGPEVGLAKAAAVQLGQHCGLPTTGFGLSTMAREVEVQFGYEKATNGLACARMGPDILSGAGVLASGMIASYEALLVEHDLVGVLWKLVDGLDVSQDSLAVPVVRDLMDGDLVLTHEHTLAHLRDGTRWAPALGQETLPEQWLARGRPSVMEEARQQAREILASHLVPPLPARVQAEVDWVLAMAASRPAVEG